MARKLSSVLKCRSAVTFMVVALLFLCAILCLCAFHEKHTISLKFDKPGKQQISNTGYYVEAQTPCSVEMVISGDTIRKITISATKTSPVVISINAKLHTPDVRVTTEWSESDGTTMLTARVPNGRLHHSISFDIKDGPITDDVLFFTRCLNLEHPGLETVKHAVLNQNYQLARTNFVKYLKSRQNPLWFFDWREFTNDEVRNTKFDTSSADIIANNILTSCNIEYEFGNTINWSINPTQPYYKEWTWQLSRHPYWIELGKAYWATGDEKYAKAFVNQARSWIIENPRPDDFYNKEYSRWRTLETGIRMRDAWIESFYRFLPSPHFDDETILMYVKSIYEHGGHLMSNHCETGNNRFAMEMNGLYKVSVMFPEFKESPNWEKYALQSLYEETKRQFYPDGAQKELAPGYHGVALRSIISIYKLAKKNNKPLPNGFVKNLEKAYDFYLKIRMPDGSLPGVNDSDFSEDSNSQLKQGLGYFPNREDYLYIVSNGEKGSMPTFKSIWMPWAGWYIMRSGWDKDALYSLFEVGPFSSGHSHEDKLSFILYGYGNSLLTEGGNYPYDTSEWREYITSARAHNVTRIDGKDQNRFAKRKKDNTLYSLESLKNRWISNRDFDFGEGWYSEGFGTDQDSSVSQYRALLFIKDKYWFLFDIFTPKDRSIHTYETIFHLDAPNAIVDEKSKMVQAMNPDKAVLQIVPLHNQDLSVNVVNGQEKPEIQGWIHDAANGINTYQCRSISTPIYKRQVAGQWIEAYLLLPLKSGEQSFIKETACMDNIYYVYFLDGSSLKLEVSVQGGKLSSLSYATTSSMQSEKIF